MAYGFYDETSPGMPNLLSVNGSLNTLLLTVLPLLGWAVEYGPTGNASVFRSPSGNRHRLNVRHDSAVSGSAALAYVRGAHTATSATAIGTPFPTAAQVPNASSNWKAGIEDDAVTPARWAIFGDEKFFHYLCRSPSYGWDWHYFGQAPSDYATGYETVIKVRNSAGPYGAFGMGQASQAYPNASGGEFFARGINATTVSTGACCDGYGAAVGRMPNAPATRGGYQNKILREKISVHDTGVASGTPGVLQIPKRIWLPNVWAPQHSALGGGAADGDTFTDSVYNPSASFRLFDAPSYGTLIVETTNTWSKP